MLLPGVLFIFFILFVTSFWLYCLIDAALTPAADCRGLPKPAWIAVVALAYAPGAVAWFAVRHHARGRAPRRRTSRYGAGSGPGFLRGGQWPAPHPGSIETPGPSDPDIHLRGPYTRGPRTRSPRMTGPGVSGSGMFGTGVTGPGMFGTGVTGPGMFGTGVTGPGMFGTGGSGRPATPGPRFRRGPRRTGRRNAMGSWLRRLAGKSPRRSSAARPAWHAGPTGPDDDPEFLRTLDRMIHGTRRPKDDPNEQ